MHFDLGVILARVGDHDGAIAEFQQAARAPTRRSKDPGPLPSGTQLRGQQLAQAGGAQLQRGHQNARSRRQRQSSIALHYRLGRVSETLGNNEAAEEHYNEVAANDYSYLRRRPALKRLN